MIILFHCLGILIFQLLRNRKRIKLLNNILSTTTKMNSSVHANLEHKIVFDPPVYLQRYGRVYQTLLDERWRTKISSLVDFGCSEFGLFVFLKRFINLRNIYFVDIDEDTLRHYLGKLRPLMIDYLKRRPELLEISIFAGSVADPDFRLHKIDVVTAVELIEHLYPDVLDAFPYNIFNHIRPKIVIVTTPNYDFNILFSNESLKFRHYDHKFEWTREQFEEWAINISVRFPNYAVTFSGIGEGPDGTEHLGQCSQMAVFIRKDLLDDKNLPKTKNSFCLCESSSPCKGPTKSQLLCNCICALCSPSTSYGICTYYSSSKKIISCDDSDGAYNQSRDMYYNLIDKIQYPFKDDYRTEEERLRDEFHYRINQLGQPWGRFFVEERNRSEIPVQDVIYGPCGFDLTESEACKLLTKFGYTIEECRIQEIGLLQTCVIYDPVMEEISSSSEASGYDSDFTKYQLNEESLSDWDDPYAKKETEKTLVERKAEMTCLQTTSREEPAEHVTDVEDDKKQDSLFDSGYQKSLSLVDDSPQTPLEELEETDVFEDTTSTPSLDSEDNKVHLKKASIIEKHSFIPQPPPLHSPDFSKFKLDMNRINEMDKFHNISSGRTFFNHFVPPPEVLKKSFLKDKDALPGPSSAPYKKRKKFRKSLQSDTDEDSPFEDVKSITNCLIENTLNKLIVKEDKQDIIEYVEPLPEPPPLPEEAPLVQVVEEPGVQEVPEVENGDLANNNRDIEGNNYIAQEEAVQNIGNDIENDNLEVVVIDPPQFQEENANFDNNNRNDEDLQAIEDPFVIVEEGGNVENAENAQAVENLIGQASREALFDPNSEQDSLEDFEIPSALHETENIVNVLNTGNNIVFIGVHTTPEENGTGSFEEQNGFPHWLLQILGTQIAIENIEAPTGSQEEPHFYCQGDGLGVHPSVIAVEIDEDEDSSDSSNNTAEFMDLDQGLSSQDMSSLPEDSQATPLLDVHENEQPPVVATTSEEDHESSANDDVGASRST